MTGSSVKSAGRVFEILEYFARTRRAARLSEIATNLGYPISSVNALLKCMVQEGYMNYDELNRCYLPSARIAHLGSWLNIDSYEQTFVLEEMYRLREVAQESVVLATPNGIYLEYVDTIHGWEGINIRRGTRRLLVQTGTGWLFLARMQLDKALAIYHRTVEAGELRYDEFPAKAFIEKLDSHRHIDVSFIHARELLRPTAHWGAAMISMIIPTPRDHRALAIGAHGLGARLEAKRELIATELHRIVSALAERLNAGFQEAPECETSRTTI